MNNKLTLTTLTLLSSTFVLQVNAQSDNKESKNVLFIIADDMRPEFGCYNSPIIQTPNIDRLAQKGVLFTNAYCNIPVSGASRTSLLTGVRPTKTKIKKWDTTTADVPTATPMNEYFTAIGYNTISNGKVYHDPNDQREHWSTIRDVSNFVAESSYDYKLESNQDITEQYNNKESKLRGWYAEGADCDDSEYQDYKVTSQTIEDLQQLSKSDEPFFLACGFSRPHLPFIVPQKYFDMYDPSQIELPNSWKLKEGNNIPYEARKGVGGELNFYSGVTRNTNNRSVEETQEIIRGYYASVSFIDAQIGRLLDELDRLGIADNTTVILIGDHGWNLAEHGGMFCKQTILYHAIRSTMIISAPDGLEGHRSNEVVEFVDLYPTICDLAGVEAPQHLEGESIKELCYNQEAKSKGYAVARWQDGWTYTDGRYFYSEWYDNNDEVTANMLFDHTNGIDDNYNLVDKPYYQKKVAELQGQYIERRGKSWNQ